MPHDHAALDLTTPTQPKAGSGILAQMKEAGRSLVSRVKHGAAGKLLPVLLAAAAALTLPQQAQAKTVTATVTGTVISGTDTSGIFGPVGGSLAGLNYTLTYIFDDTKGTPFSNNCASNPYQTGLNDQSGAGAGVAILRIGSGQYQIGGKMLSDEIQVQSYAERSAGNNSCNSGGDASYLVSVNYQNVNNPADYQGSAQVGTNGFPMIQPATGTIFTTDPNWENQLSNSNLSANGSISFAISAITTITGLPNYQANGQLRPVSITVGAPGLTPAKTLGDCGCAAPGGTGVAGVGDPINVVTGNVFEQVQDYRTAGQNPLGFTRYYNSQQTAYNPGTPAVTLGANWRSNFDRYLNIVSGSTVTAERPDGQVITFTLQGSTWTTDTDVDLTLTQNGSTWTLKDRNDTTESYTVSGSTGTLQSITARNGYTQTLNYAAGQLSSVTDSYSRSLNFTYSGGLLNTVSTPDGLTLTYGFTPVSGSNVLTTVAYNASPASNITYQYNNPSFPLALTGLLDENGQQFGSWSYDTQGRGVSSQRGGSLGANATTATYNADGTTTVTNALGVADTYKFGTLQGLQKVTEIDRAATSTTAAAKRTFGYDSNAYLNSETDWNGNLTAFVNNAQGNPTTINYAVGAPQAFSVTISYDPTFIRLPHQIVAPGLTSTFVYDGSGNPLSRTDLDTTTQSIPYSTNGQTRVTQFTWSGTGELQSVQLPRTDVIAKTTLGYDATGALTSIKDALNHQTNITAHTGGGLPQTVVDPNNVTTTLAYDGRLNLHTSTVQTGAGNFTTTWTYDPANNLQSIQKPDGSKLTLSYDTAHRLIGIADLFSNTITATLDALGDPTLIQVKNSDSTVTQQHSAVFDALGRVTSDIGGMNQTTTFTYDKMGNVLTISPPAPSGTITRTFDALNRLKTSVDPSPGGTTTITYDSFNVPLTVKDANNNTTSYVYDGFRDRIQTASPDSGTTVYHYDPDRNLITAALPGSITKNYTFDALDRPLTTTYTGDTTLNVSRTYDQTTGHGFGIGRLTSATDQPGSLSLTYDERGNITAESRTVTGAGTLNMSTAFDAASNVSSITYPSGTVVAYSRDSMGRVTGITAKPPGAGSPSNVATGISYEPFGPVTGLTFGNAFTGTYSFDNDYRATSRVDQVPGFPVLSLSYGYYANDSVNTITDAVNAANSQTLNYDALDRLTSASSGSGGYGSYSWTWDAVNNVKTQVVNGTTTTFTDTTGSNKLSKWVTGPTTTTVTNTAAGNLNTLKVGTTTTETLTYNKANQMASSQTTSSSASYKHDLDGQRIEKLPPGSNPILYQFGRTAGELLAENDLHNGQTADYIYLNGRPIGEVNPTNGKIYFMHTDRLGTPDRVTGSGFTVVWNALYNPFGDNPIGGVSGTLATQSLRLPGQYFDPETGYNHNGFRDYAGTLTRYVQTDPIGLAGGMNTYQYVRGNPFKYTDPRGLDPTINDYPNQSNPVYGGANLYLNAQQYNGPPGSCSVAGHGSLSTLAGYTPAQLAGILSGNPACNQGQPIILLACNTGRDYGFSVSYADQLQAELKKLGIKATVTAPNDYIWIYPNGSIVIAPEKGYTFPDHAPDTIQAQPDTTKPGRWYTTPKPQ